MWYSIWSISAKWFGRSMSSNCLCNWPEINFCELEFFNSEKLFKQVQKRKRQNLLLARSSHWMNPDVSAFTRHMWANHQLSHSQKTTDDAERVFICSQNICVCVCVCVCARVCVCFGAVAERKKNRPSLETGFANTAVPTIRRKTATDFILVLKLSWTSSIRTNTCMRKFHHTPKREFCLALQEVCLSAVRGWKKKKNSPLGAHNKLRTLSLILFFLFLSC